jgi:hypothetical protein
LAKDFAEVLHAAMKIDAYGAVRQAGARGDFGSGHAFDETKHKRFAVGFWKREDGFERNARFRGGLRSTTVGGRELAGIGDGVIVERNIGLGAAMKIDGVVARDGGQPAGKTRNVAQGVKAWHGLKKNVLDEIVDVGVRDARKKNAMDHAGVARVEKPEGGAVAGLGGANEGVVGVVGAGIGWDGHGERTGAKACGLGQCGQSASIERKGLTRETGGGLEVLTRVRVAGKGELIK